MSVDKSLVREDYIRGFSVRMLSAKYGVPKSTVNDWIKKYGWVQEGKIRTKANRTPDKRPTETVRERIQQRLNTDQHITFADDFDQLHSYAQKLLWKADQILDLDDALAPRDLKSLSSMLLDVRTLLHVMSPIELEEQEIRLAALRRQAQQEEKTEQAVVVRFVDTEEAES